jgi:hypothetical protein
VASQRLGDTGGTLRAEGDLHRTIAVSVSGFDLGYTVVRHINHGNGDSIALVRKNTGHPNLATEQSKAHFFSDPGYDWPRLIVLLALLPDLPEKSGKARKFKPKAY